MHSELYELLMRQLIDRISVNMLLPDYKEYPNSIETGVDLKKKHSSVKQKGYRDNY